MKCTGITAEYNPFHAGHGYHISKTRELFEGNLIAVVMSGNFVQRGDIAIFDKYTRAKTALENGADIVFELPTVFSLACAERFAHAAVALFEYSSVTDSISFGSESADIDKIYAAAYCSLNESQSTQAQLKAELKKGVPYAKAHSEVFSLCELPNDVLGTEYVKAIQRLSSPMQPAAIKRTGAMHDSSEASADGFYSASMLRSAILSGKYDYRCNAVPVSSESSEFSAALLFKLRSMSKDELALLPDVSEGLENVLYRCCREAASYADFLTLSKSRRYTLARLRRIAFSALLSITDELQKNALANPLDHLYLRVLGIRKNALPLLSELSKNSRIPVITSYSDIENLSENAKKLLEKDIHASDIYNIFAQNSAVSDYRKPLIIV